MVYVNETQFKLHIQRIKEPKYTIFRPTGFLKKQTHTHTHKMYSIKTAAVAAATTADVCVYYSAAPLEERWLKVKAAACSTLKGH